MAFNKDNIWKPTPEERTAAIQAALEERARIIQEAIRNGATVQYITSRITLNEQETHIMYGNDDICTIDTTIPKDITMCIKRGWKIIGVTYYADTKILAGIICEAKSKHVSIRNVKE